MIEERLQDISVVKFVESILPAEVKVVDGFPEERLKEEDLPIVAVENRSALFENLELGSKTQLVSRTWIIYVYAINKTQRDNILYTIAKNLKNNIPVYDYNIGFPPDVSPPQIGCLQFKRVNAVVNQIDTSMVSIFYRTAEVYYTAVYKSEI